MEKYSLEERCMLLPYDRIERKNVVRGDLSYLSLFLFFYIKNTNKKSINTDFRLCKPVRITAHTNRKFNNMFVSISEVLILNPLVL